MVKVGENTQNYEEPLLPVGTRATQNFGFGNLDPRTKYLIITPEAFRDALEPLAAWKHQKGVFTSIALLDGPEGINATYSGPDLPARIHAFLREFYEYADDLKWLLLVGDSEIIPPRLILTTNVTGGSFQYLYDNTYADYYYSALDTTWDNNSNLIYGETGEEDWVPELFVGRLPVNNISEVNTVVNKILVYEKNPPYGDWLSKTIQCGALMDRPNVLDNLLTFEDEGYNWYKDNAYEVILKVRQFLPSGMTNNTFLDYDRIQGGEFSRANDTLNESNVLESFNLGASTVNFVSKGDDDGVRHYNGNGFGKIEYASEHFFNYNTLKKVSNGYRLPLVYTSSCTSANFTETDDSNLEGLITSPLGGAIGFIGATIETYRLEFIENNTSYGNWWLNEQFWRKFFSGEGRFRPGEILYKLKQDYYLHYTTNKSNPHADQDYQPLYRTNFFSYNLLGDPEVPIYTDVPIHLKVEHPQKILPIHRNHSFTIKVFDQLTNQPVNDADVCLMGNDIYLTARTDDQGLAKLDLKVNKDKTLKLTVTAHNHYYYEGSIKVEARQDLLVRNEDIKFEENPIPPGTTANISFEIHNNGSSELSNIKVNCYYDQISNDHLVIENLIIDTFPISGIKTFSFNWTPPLGSHLIIVVVDVDDQILEFNESNNIAENMLIENKPPIISNLPDKVIYEDTPLLDALDLKFYTWDFDTPPQLLQFSITNISNPEFNITIKNQIASFYPPANWHGNVSVVVSVFDGTTMDTDDFTIIVRSVNDPPIINDTIEWVINSDNITVSPGYISVLEDDLVNFTVLADDPFDNDTDLTFSAETDLFKINSITGDVLFKPDNSMVGTYEINFSVSDGAEANGLDHRLVTFEILNVNDPPELVFLGTHYLTVGKLFEFQVEGTDIDQNDTLQFRDNTEFFEIDPETGFVSYKPKKTHIGTHNIKITVTDGVDSDSKNLTLIIKSAPEGPVDPNYVLICPFILVILLLLLFTQEYLKNRKAKADKNGKNKRSPEEATAKANGGANKRMPERKSLEKGKHR
ncbi:C25 family cysteine peptidase [[Eubacterium] cellulosolvens]